MPRTVPGTPPFTGISFTSANILKEKLADNHAGSYMFATRCQVRTEPRGKRTVRNPRPAVSPLGADQPEPPPPPRQDSTLLIPPALEPSAPPAAELPGDVPPTARQAELPLGIAKPRPQRFLFISKWGLIHDLAWEVKKEGHEVRYHIMMKSERDVGEGFVEKVDRWEESRDWADVIIFDDCEFGPLADRLRRGRQGGGRRTAVH